jgi:hypothetical protein
VPVELWASRDAQWVQARDVNHPAFEGVSSMGVVFSPNSSEFAYPALTDSGWVVVRSAVGDSVAVPSEKSWDGIGAILFSPEAKRLAYAAERDSLWFVVEDGKVGPSFVEILERSLEFSADGSRLAYLGRSVDGTHLVVAEVVGPPFDAVGSFALSRDGNRVAYAVRDGNRARVLVDGMAGDDWVAVKDVIITDDGQHVAFAGRQSDGWRIVVDGVAGEVFRRVREPGFDGAGHVYYVAADSTGEFIVRASERTGASAAIRQVILSGEGSRLGYIADRDSVSQLVVDGEVLAERTVISEMAFSGNGEVVGYVAEEADVPLVAIGEEEFALDLVVGGSLVLNHDGSRWACLGGADGVEEIRLVIDGEVTERRLDWAEFMDSLMASPFNMLEDSERQSYFRSWVSAELELANGS